MSRSELFKRNIQMFSYMSENNTQYTQKTAPGFLPKRQLPFAKKSTPSTANKLGSGPQLQRTTPKNQQSQPLTKSIARPFAVGSRELQTSTFNTKPAIQEQNSYELEERPFTTVRHRTKNSYFIRRGGTNGGNFSTQPQMPGLKSPVSVEVTSLLEALRSEPKVSNPKSIYDDAMKRVGTLKKGKTLDKYALSDEEAATLCAVPLLMKAGINFSEFVEACKVRPPSKLFVLLLKSFRKLPQTRGIIYFGEASTSQVNRTNGSYLQRNFVVASASMQTVKECLEGEGVDYKEIFRVEGGWGYDIGDFVQSEEGFISDFIILEPWRAFSVVDCGIKKDNEASIVLLRMTEGRFAYENEIKPGMLQYIIPTLEKNQKSLNILSEMTFDNRDCKKK